MNKDKQIQLLNECLKKIKDIDVDSSQQLNNIAIYIHWRICKLIEEINKG